MVEQQSKRYPYYKCNWFLIFLSLLLIGFIFIGYYGYQIWTAANRTYIPPKQKKSEKRKVEVVIDEDPVSLLFLGVDERKGDIGRSDTMIISTINPNKKTVILTNIPRDTLVKIPGRKRKDKMNHSYAYGGVDLTRKTVENFLDLPIDGYVKVNMQGLEKIVDELDGIEVNVPFDFIFEGNYFKKGKMYLNGKQALSFSRMRKVDPNGDLGRIRRQQEVVRGIIHKGTELSSLPKLNNIMEEVGNNIQTDISPLKLFNLQRIYANVKDENITTLQLKATHAKIHDIFYLLVSGNEIKRIHNQLTKHIELNRNQGTPTPFH